MGSPITSHAFNGSLDKLAVSDNSTTVYVYAKEANGKWTKETELQKVLQKQELLHYVFIMRGFPATNRREVDHHEVQNWVF